MRIVPLLSGAVALAAITATPLQAQAIGAESVVDEDTGAAGAATA